MNHLSIVLGLLFVAGCASTPSDILVLNYGDFGPQAAAYETIGMEWWQWDNHGDPDPRKGCDVKVVVYRDIPLSTVKRRYPVDQKQKLDYRYLSYSDALKYLDKNIAENVLPELTEDLRKTKTRIMNELEKPNNGVVRTR